MKPIVPEDRHPHELSRIAAEAFVRSVVCIGRAALQGRTASPADVAKRDFAADRNLPLVLRAASSPATIANAGGLAQLAKAFLELLVPVSAGADLLARGIGVSFDHAASITVPGISLPSGAFVGEGSPIPVQQATTSAGVTLTPFKLGTICVLTGELIRSSSAEALVRQALVESVGPRLDAILLSNAAGTVDHPPGLRNGIAALTPAPITGPDAKAGALVDDLAALATAVAPVAGNSDIVYVAAPAQAVAMRMRVPTPVEPVFVSASLAAGTVIAIAVNALVSAIDGPPQIDAKQDVELVMADPAAPVVDIGGVWGQPVMSTFQIDSVALRLLWPLTWGLRDARGLAWLQSVNW